MKSVLEDIICVIICLLDVINIVIQICVCSQAPLREESNRAGKTGKSMMATSTHEMAM